MKPSFHTWLMNTPFEDPCLYVDIFREKRSILFDLGSLSHISPKKLLKVSDIFISHTHIDHFIGFDHLLRLLVNRDKRVRIFGPPGIIQNVEGKLSAYTWNLVDNSPLAIEVHEIDDGRMDRCDFLCSRRFRPEQKEPSPFTGLILDDPFFTVKTTALDHRVPSMAYSLIEKEHINIRKDALITHGFSTGPWLSSLKKLIRQGETDKKLAVPGESGECLYTVDDLQQRLVKITRGQKISYVVDTAFHQSNVDKIISLIKGSDLLYIEAMFAEEETKMAGERYHLTAKQAGEIAKEAGVGEITVFHHSPRYADDPSRLRLEAERYFKGVFATD